MGEKREFDPGLDTPTAYEPGAGQPVPGSPVWQDARLRERQNDQQLQAEQEAAANPLRGDEVKPNVTDSTHAETLGKSEASRQSAARAAQAEKDAAATAKAEKAATAKQDKAARGDK